MKLSTKIILPIILISALLILLAGCFGVPADESPGYTPGNITGIIAAPCCSTSAEPVSETCCVAPEYWCFYCQQTWSLQDGIEVVLTYGEDEVATTTTNDKGEFTFTNVDPGKNYVITAYCPDFADNRPLVKDVALELIEGGSFDTKITDLVSTSLGLVVDFLVNYTEMGPEDISLIEVIADKPSFPNFPKFKKLVYEVRRVLENCEVNMLTDDDLQDALCFASEEVGRVTFPDLVIGCVAGYTPPPPTPGVCDGNLSAIIDSVSIDGVPVDIDDIVNVVLGESYDILVTAHDQDTKLGTLTYYAKANGFESPATTSNQVTITPPLPGTFEVFVYVHDGCAETEWGPVTVDVCQPVDQVVLAPGIDDTICVGETVALGDLIGSIKTYAGTVLQETITDPCDPRLAFSFTNANGAVSFNLADCEVTGVTAGDVDITVVYTPGTGECGTEPVSGDAAISVTVEASFDELRAIGGDLTLCLGDTGPISDILTGVELWYQGSWVRDVSLTDPRLSFSSKTAGILTFTGSNYTAAAVGSTDITVAYTPDVEECGSADPVDAGVVVTVEASFDELRAIGGDLTLCLEDTGPISDILTGVELWYQGSWVRDVSLTDPRLSFSSKTAGILTFTGSNYTAAAVGSTDITVAYTPDVEECGSADPVDAGVVVTVEASFDELRAIGGDLTLCLEDTGPISDILTGVELWYQGSWVRDVSLTDPRLSFSSKTAGILTFTGSNYTAAAVGSTDITVAYTPDVEECGSADPVDAGVVVTVEASFDELRAIGGDLTLCLGDTGPISDILTGVELWYQGSWVRDVSLTDPRLSFSSKTAGILTFTGSNYTAAAVGSTDITVAYTPDVEECGSADPVDAGVVVTVEASFDELRAIGGDLTLCLGDTGPISDILTGVELWYQGSWVRDVSLTDPRLSFSSKTAGILTFTGSNYTAAAVGSTDITVAYTPDVEECGSADPVDAGVVVTVEASFDELRAIGGDLTLCLGDTGPISDILTGVELWYQGSWVRDVSLTDPRLSFSSKTAGILTFTGSNYTAAAVGSTDITVAYTPDVEECGSADPVDAGVVVTVEECPCILSELTLITNKHGRNSGDPVIVDFTEFTEISPGIFEIDIPFPNNDNNLSFIPITVNCDGYMSYKYNYIGCHGTDITLVETVVSGDEYPQKSDGSVDPLTMCNPPASNILTIYLSNGDTYIIYINR